MEHAFSTLGPTFPTRCRTRCRSRKTGDESISFYGKRQRHHQPCDSRKCTTHFPRKVLKVGRSQSERPISMATCFRKSISPTTLVPIACCTTAQHQVTRASSCCTDDDR